MICIETKCVTSQRSSLKARLNGLLNRFLINSLKNISKNSIKQLGDDAEVLVWVDMIIYLILN